METGLDNKTVIVTGATANIGRAIALAFAEEAANVVIVGRDESQGRKVRDEALARGASAALWQKADVLKHDQVSKLVQASLERFGQIDVLVNNVGGNADVRPFVETTPEQWRYDLDINVGSTLICTHAVLPHMIERESGCIINIGSMSGIVGDRLISVYSAAKGAVHSFAKVLASEVGRYGITVNAIAPYATPPDDFNEHVSSGSRSHPDGILMRVRRERPEEHASIRRKTALPRQNAKPAEIGAAAVYLASDMAGFITGEVLCVDGGVRVA